MAIEMSETIRQFIADWTQAHHPAIADQMVQIVNYGRIRVASASPVDLRQLIAAAFDAGVMHAMQTRNVGDHGSGH